MSDVIKARDELEAVAKTLELLESARLSGKIRWIINTLLVREYGPRKKAPPTAKKLTKTLKERIRVYAGAHPKASMRAIGAHFGVDGGRVSEVLRGKR